MKLYSKSSEAIEVFELEPKPLAICQYKYEVLTKNNPRFFYAYSDEYPKPLDRFSVDKRKGEPIEEVIINSSPETYLSERSANYLYEDDQVDLNSFITNYSESRYSSDPTQIVTKNRSREILYRLLLTEPFYYGHILKGIVDLPKSIYLLRLLEKGNFNELVDEDISEHLRLFDFKPIDRISIDVLKRAYNYGVIPGGMGWTDEKVKESGPILEKIKNLHN